MREPWARRRDYWGRSRPRSASSDGGDDGDFGALGHFGVQVTLEANILVIRIDIDETAQRAGVVEDATLDIGIRLGKTRKGLADGAGVDGNAVFAAGIFSKRRRDSDMNGHRIFL